MAASTKLWIVCAVLVVGLVFVLLISSMRPATKLIAEEPVDNPVGVYTDSNHKDFVISFKKLARKRGLHIEASFLSDKTFKIVMPCDVEIDEVSFLSRSAATGIFRHFGVSPIIRTYTEDNDNPTPKLVATTAWSSNLGDFRVKFEAPMGTE